MLLWVGARVSVDFVQHVLGAPAFQSIDSKQTKLPELDNELSARVRGIVDEIQQQRNVVFPLVIVKQKDPTEVNPPISAITICGVGPSRVRGNVTSGPLVG